MFTLLGSSDCPLGGAGIVYVQSSALVLRMVASAALSCEAALPAVSTKKAALVPPFSAIEFRLLRLGPTPSTYVGMGGVPKAPLSAAAAAFCTVLLPPNHWAGRQWRKRRPRDALD